MALSIIALFVFVFGAYAYGYLTVLYLRRWPVAARVGRDVQWQLTRVSATLFVACTVWFVLHAIIELRFLMNDPRENDLIDLAALEMTLLFPGLIFHMYLSEARADRQAFVRPALWNWVVGLLYAAGALLAVYFTAVIFHLLPTPERFGEYIGIAIGSLFSATSVACLMLTQARPTRTRTREQHQLARAMRVLFLGMIVLFITLVGLREHVILIRILDVCARTTPLFFLLVSVYFENRIEFYDLVIKRGVLLMLTLLSIAAVAALAVSPIDALPQTAARPWLLAVFLLPVAMVMPWLHDRVGRLLDRLWFGRDFTSVDAIKHVLASMQAATDEPSLIAAAESALSDIFRRRILVLRQHDPLPDQASEVTAIRTTEGTTVRFASTREAAGRALLSEDIALLRSLGGVFGYLLENVRLQRKRLEQEHVAQELRLQSSRSELKALRAQINPHFLFNALNAIASLIHTDPARADVAVEQLAEVFRYTLRRSEQEWAPLDQELAFARAYLDVEQARFGKRLEYSVHSDASVARAQVPAMLLQTLVENAVKHGISRLRGAGRVDVVTTLADGRLGLEVRDNGPGIDSGRDGSQRPGESFGLRSVRDRLEGHFGGRASLDLRRDGDVTIARIELPLIEDLSPAAGRARQAG